MTQLTRRSWFQALAALPFIGKLFGKPENDSIARQLEAVRPKLQNFGPDFAAEVAESRLAEWRRSPERPNA